MNSYFLLLLCFLLGIVIYLIVNNTETLSISCDVEPSTIGCGSYMSTPINCSKLVYYDKHYRNALILKNDIFGLSKLTEFTDIKDNNNPIFYDDTLDSLVPYITNRLHNKRSTYTDFNYNLEAKYFDENGCPTVNAYPSTWEDFISQTNKAMSQILIIIKKALGDILNEQICNELFSKKYKNMNMKPEYITTIEKICYNEFKKLKFRYFNRRGFSHFVHTEDGCNLRSPYYKLFSMNTTDSLFKFIENGTKTDYYDDEKNYNVNSAGVIKSDQSFVYSNSKIFESINIILLKQICANKYMKEKFVPANSCKVNVQKTINNIYNNYNKLDNSSISNNGTPEKILLNEYIENLESKTCEVYQDLGKCLPSGDISDTLLSCQVDPTICETAGGQYDTSDNQCKCPKIDDNGKSIYSCPSSASNSSDIFKLNKLEEGEICLFPVGIRGEFNYGCNNDLICETKQGSNNYGRCISSKTNEKSDMEPVAKQAGCDFFTVKTPIDLFRCGKALQVLEEVTEVDEGLVLLDEVPGAGEVLMAGEVVSEGAALTNAGIKCHNVLSDISHLESLIDNCGIDMINKKVQQLENIYTKDSSESSGFL